MTDIKSDLFNQEAIIKYIKGLFCDNYNPSYNRYLIPCKSDYIKLKLKDEITTPYIDKYYVPYSAIVQDYDKMLSPYLIIKEDLPDNKRKINIKKVITETLYNWVYQNRHDESLTKEEIIEIYKKFTDYFDEKVLNMED